MKFIKRNKGIIIALVVFFILILLCVEAKNLLFGSNGATYGNRLDNRVELSKDLDKKIKDSLISGVDNVKVRVSGNIINITLTLADEVTKDIAKGYAKKALESLTTEEANCYDVQFYLVKNSEATDFPIIGYKIPTEQKITWTKDR